MNVARRQCNQENKIYPNDPAEALGFPHQAIPNYERRLRGS